MIQDPSIEIISSPRNREENQELMKLLKILRSIRFEYPPELFKARRATFIVQVGQRFPSDSQSI